MAQNPQMMQQQLQQPQNFYMNQMSASPQAQLYVGDLEEEITEETLYQKFSKFGPIFTLKIMRDSQTKKSRGFAFIQYYQQANALEAVSKANHTQIINNRIRVAMRKNIKEVINNDANVYIKNIDETVSEKQLEDHLKKYGKIMSSKISLGKKQQSLGYGYVQFEKKEEAERCIKEGQNLKVGNKNIQVFKFESKKNRVDTKNNLYIKNLPKGKTEEELKHLIEQKFTEIVLAQKEDAQSEEQKINVDQIISSTLVKIDPKAQLPFAFVCFEKHQYAQKIQEECNDKDIFEKDQKLYVSWFQTKHEREKALNQVAYKSAANETNLFTKNLASTVTKEQLKEQFKSFGEITSCDVKQPPQLNKQNQDGANADPKAYTQTLQGFINFANKESAKEALMKAKDKESIKALYVMNKVFLNYHIKKDQYQKFQQQKKRQEQLTQNQRQLDPFGFKGGPNARNQQLMNAQFLQQMSQMYAQLMPMLMRMPPMMPNFFGMPQNSFQMPPPFMNYGNLPQRGPNQMNMMGPGHHNMQQPRGGHQQQQQGMMKPGQQNRGNPKKRGPQGQKRQGGHQGGHMYQHQGPHQQMNFGAQNINQPPQPQSAQQQQGVAQPSDNFVPFTPQTLKSRLDEFQKLDKERQRLQLGEMIFPMVKKIVSTQTNDEQVAPKVTGMLIDFDVFEVTDILEFLEDENILVGRIKEAIELINETQNQSSNQTN